MADHPDPQPERTTRTLPVTWHPDAVQRAKDVAAAILDASTRGAFYVEGKVMSRLDLMVLLDGLRQSTEAHEAHEACAVCGRVDCLHARDSRVNCPTKWGTPADPDVHTGECRSEDGITIGLIDGLISVYRVLAGRDLTAPGAQAALQDLTADGDVASVHGAVRPDTPTDLSALMCEAVGSIAPPGHEHPPEWVGLYVDAAIAAARHWAGVRGEPHATLTKPDVEPDMVSDDGVACWVHLAADVYADGTGREKTVRLGAVLADGFSPATARHLAEALNAAADYAEEVNRLRADLITPEGEQSCVDSAPSTRTTPSGPAPATAATASAAEAELSHAEKARAVADVRAQLGDFGAALAAEALDYPEPWGTPATNGAEWCGNQAPHGEHEWIGYAFRKRCPGREATPLPYAADVDEVVRRGVLGPRAGELNQPTTSPPPREEP